MFKIGDEIIFIGNDGPRFSHGRIYVVLYANTEHFIVRDNSGRDLSRSQSQMERRYWELNHYASPKEKLPAPKNDIEWLDRVQQNFKE